MRKGIPWVDLLVLWRWIFWIERETETGLEIEFVMDELVVLLMFGISVVVHGSH